MVATLGQLLSLGRSSLGTIHAHYLRLVVCVQHLLGILASSNLLSVRVLADALSRDHSCMLITPDYVLRIVNNLHSFFTILLASLHIWCDCSVNLTYTKI